MKDKIRKLEIEKDLLLVTIITIMLRKFSRWPNSTEEISKLLLHLKFQREEELMRLQLGED